MQNFKDWIEIKESISLSGNYKGGIYQRLVAAYYKMAPTKDESAIPAFEDLASKMNRQHDFLKSKFEFVPQTGFDTFSTKKLRSIIQTQKDQGIKKPQLPVLSDPPGEGEGHPAFSNDTNIRQRGVHDVMGHIYGNHPISARGEYASYNRHLKTLCNVDQVKGGNCLAAKALFTEIVGQTSYYYVYGTYCKQKAVILNEFDHWNVGQLNPNSRLNIYFVLNKKQLMTRPDFNYDSFYEEFPALANELNSQEMTSKRKLSTLV